MYRQIDALLSTSFAERSPLLKRRDERQTSVNPGSGRADECNTLLVDVERVATSDFYTGLVADVYRHAERAVLSVARVFDGEATRATTHDTAFTFVLRRPES